MVRCSCQCSVTVLQTGGRQEAEALLMFPMAQAFFREGNPYKKYMNCCSLSNDDLSKSSFILFLVEEWKQGRCAPKFRKTSVYLWGKVHLDKKHQWANNTSRIGETVFKSGRGWYQNCHPLSHVATNFADDTTIPMMSPQTWCLCAASQLVLSKWFSLALTIGTKTDCSS